MRDIKFRAWNKKEKWMDDEFFIKSNGVTHDAARRAYDTPNIEIEEVKNLVIMQFTGLKDKNGVEIYESDILLIEGKYVQYVDWNENLASWGSRITKSSATLTINVSQVVVIGNVHENPLLVEQ